MDMIAVTRSGSALGGAGGEARRPAGRFWGTRGLAVESRSGPVTGDCRCGLKQTPKSYDIASERCTEDNFIEHHQIEF